MEQLLSSPSSGKPNDTSMQDYVGYFYWYCSRYKSIKAKLQELHKDGYLILFLMNDNIGADHSFWALLRSIHKAWGMHLLQQYLGVPCAAVLMTESFCWSNVYQYLRMPNPTIWERAMGLFNDGIEIDSKASFICGTKESDTVRELAERVGVQLIDPHEMFNIKDEANLCSSPKSESPLGGPCGSHLSISETSTTQPHLDPSMETQEPAGYIDNDEVICSVIDNDLIEELIRKEYEQLHSRMSEETIVASGKVTIADYSLSGDKPAMTKYRTIDEDGNMVTEELVRNKEGQLKYRQTEESTAGTRTTSETQWDSTTPTIAMMTRDVDEFDQKVPIALRVNLKRLDGGYNPKKLLQTKSWGDEGNGLSSSADTSTKKADYVSANRVKGKSKELETRKSYLHVNVNSDKVS